MTPSFYDLRLVNTKVNLLPYASELVDDWKPAETEGDCDSYATAKQWRLVHAYGWPETALRYLLILCSLVLVGCTEPSILRGSGELATPPAGYSKLCIEHPELASCPK